MNANDPSSRLFQSKCSQLETIKWVIVFIATSFPFANRFLHICTVTYVIFPGYRCYLEAQFSIVHDAFISINPLIGCYDTFATAHVTQTRIESCFKRINFSVIPIQCLWICIAFQCDIILNSQLHQLELLLPSNYSTHKMKCYCNRSILLYDLVICSTFMECVCLPICSA